MMAPSRGWTDAMEERYQEFLRYIKVSHDAHVWAWRRSKSTYFTLPRAAAEQISAIIRDMKAS
jgi:hypothetical protein